MTDGRASSPWRDYSPALVGAARLASKVLFRFPYKVSYSGLAHLPAEGPAVVAANHASYFDPWFLSMATPRPLYYLAWHGLFRSRLFAAMIERCGARPVNIDNPADRTAFRTAHGILREGHLLCIFPEGIRGYDGRLNPLQQGFVRIAQGAGAPIVPVWIEGVVQAWPRWKRLPRLGGEVHVEVLPPLPTRDRESGKRLEPGTVLASYRAAMLEAEERAKRRGTLSRSLWEGGSQSEAPSA